MCVCVDHACNAKDEPGLFDDEHALLVIAVDLFSLAIHQGQFDAKEWSHSGSCEAGRHTGVLI